VSQHTSPETTPTATYVDVLVVGAGQAALALAYHLNGTRHTYLLVDAAPEIGHSWRSRWDALHLFTPSEHDALPGMPFPAAAGSYPGKDDVANYLRDYAETFAVPTRMNTRVERVRRHQDLYVADTSSGQITARQVVVATGPFQRPIIPSLGRSLPRHVTQLHSSQYRNPEQIADGPVLVVGGGNSGLQIAAELYDGHEVTVAVGSQQSYVPQRILGRDLFWWMTRLGVMNAPATTRRGRRMKSRGDLVVGTHIKDLERRGIRVLDRAVSVIDDTVVLQDGTRVQPRTVVWATGFRRDHTWIEVDGAFLPDGSIAHSRGWSDVPGLSFIGLPWQHTRGSALLGFVKDDGLTTTPPQEECHEPHRPQHSIAHAPQPIRSVRVPTASPRQPRGRARHPPPSRLRLMGTGCRRVLRLAAIAVAAALLAYLGTLAGVRGPVAAYRMATNGGPSVDTWRIFPQRSVENTGVPAALATSPMPRFPETVTVPDFFDVSQKRVARWNDLFAQTDTRAFVVVHDDAVVYEAYPNGANRDDVQPGFSVTKSFMSTLVGIAIHDGKIRSVDDPVVGYLPELRGRGLDDLRIRDLLTMSSGVGFDQVGAVSPLLAPFSDDPRVYYSPDLRSIALSVRAGTEPVGQAFRYNDYYLLLEGIILERVTGQSLSSYLSTKLWTPLQMEHPASWSLDSDTDSFEKPEAGLNARALDFARLGLLYLHGGRWGSQQVVPSSWVREATAPDAGDTRPWITASRWKEIGGYYGYHWWGLRGRDDTYDFMARGNLGQIIYVSPATNTVVVRLGGGPDPDTLWPFAIRALIADLYRTEEVVPAGA